MADVVYHTRSRESTASMMQRQVLSAAVHRAFKDCRDDDNSSVEGTDQVPVSQLESQASQIHPRLLLPEQGEQS